VRSTIAILIAVAINFVLSIGIDSIFHATGVFPPMAEPMPDAGDNLLACPTGWRSRSSPGGRCASPVSRRAGTPWRSPLVGTALGMFGAVMMTEGRSIRPGLVSWSLAASAFPAPGSGWLIAAAGKPTLGNYPFIQTG
jgi:hypothetical protein